MDETQFTQRPRSWAWTGVLTGLVTLILAGCSSSPVSSPQPSSPNAPSVPSSSPRAINNASPVTNPPGVKPALTGLIDMGIQASYGGDQPFLTVNVSEVAPYVGDFSGIVINENWGQLEPSQGVYNWSDLDSSLSALTAFNEAHPTGQLYAKLRIFGGNGAPDWAKAIGGPPISVTLKNHPRTYGRWWTPAYEAAWSDFQHAMAARYDTNPLIRAVSVGSCASSTGEPFVTEPGKASISVLEAAGWTSSAQQSCLQNALSDYSGWKTTPIEFAFSPFEDFSGYTFEPDPTFMTQIMTACVNSLARGGPECIPGNNALSDNSLSSKSAPAYQEIDTLWNQKPASFQAYFQTVGAPVDCQAIALGISYHATAIELWPPQGRLPGFSGVPAQDLAQWNQDLKTSTVPTC